MLGDIVDIPMPDGPHRGKVVLLGETGSYAGLDDETARWAIDTGHVATTQILVVWIGKNPLESNDPNYAPVANNISTDLCCVVLVARDGEQDAPAKAGRPS